MKLIQATTSDLDILTPLFDGYILFYKGESNPQKYREYLAQRIENNEAYVFIAVSENGEGMGFTLLYPSFSSVSQARIFVLNDLFVHPDYRKQGVATALMETAGSFSRDKGAIRMHLETEMTNTKAQKLYEKKGWIKEKGFFHYNLEFH